MKVMSLVRTYLAAWEEAISLVWLELSSWMLRGRAEAGEWNLLATVRERETRDMTERRSGLE